MTTYEIKVYKIWYDDEPDEFYIGSTKYDRLSRRMTKHRSSAKKGTKYKLYDFIRRKGLDFKYIQIASCMVSCVDEQNAFEQQWIDELKPTLNSQRAHGFDIERQNQWRIDNAEKLKQWRVDNAEKLNNKSKQYYQDNANKMKQKCECECGGKYTYQNKSTHSRSKRHIKYLNDKKFDDVYKKFKEHFNL